jgi:hypothetical protein
MILARFFARRPDGRAAIPPDPAAIQRHLDKQFAARKAARSEPNAHKRGHITRQIDARARQQI